ncbi:MAG: transposase [Deltaproteobacteria bacterium]|nr:transposase [Deltaproteobacteria bacterium]
MPRQARLDSPGTLHHVIIRGIEKKPIVKDEVDRKAFVDRLGQLALESQTAVYAWALMTNHVHILLQSGPKGLPSLMRRLLTGYAITFNRRHRRHGHLFQNRYKSIICDEDAYFMELVRYIHLNPLRASLVKSLAALDTYTWCGHAMLLGRAQHEWHHTDHVLSWFGKSAGAARRAYRDFVERVLEEAEKDFNRSLKTNRSSEKLEQFILKACRDANVSVDELKSGSRRAPVSSVRAKLAISLVKNDGVAMATVARSLGVSTAAISLLVSRERRIS